MIYVDTSVALAHLLGEDRRPRDELWLEALVSSELLAYEVRVRIHALDLAATLEDAARALLARVDQVSLSRDFLERAGDPFPRPVRTLDALHLSTCAWLRNVVPDLALATYDTRMSDAAEAMGIPLAEL